MNILESELVLKFSDYFDAFLQKNANWNCGFTIRNNKYVFLCRNEVSRYSEAYWGKKANPYPRAVPTYAEISFDNSLECVKLVNKSKDYVLSDVRIFNFKNQLFSTGTYRSDKFQKDGKRRVDQFLARQLDQNLIFLPFEHTFDLPQKNWTPIVIEDKLFFENYDQKFGWRDVMEYSGGKLKLINRSLTKHRLRGNCQMLRYKDSLLGFYHYHKKRYYWNYVTINEPTPPFNPIKISNPFRFLDNDVFISYGVQDGDNYLIKIPIQKLC